MLQFAVSIADGKRGEDLDDDSPELSLLNAAEATDSSEVKDQLYDVVTQLFKDAGAEYQRTNSHGIKYSIEEDAYKEFIHWFDMPWE